MAISTSSRPLLWLIQKGVIIHYIFKVDKDIMAIAKKPQMDFDRECTLENLNGSSISFNADWWMMFSTCVFVEKAELLPPCINFAAMHQLLGDTGEKKRLCVWICLSCSYLICRVGVLSFQVTKSCGLFCKENTPLLPYFLDVQAAVVSMRDVAEDLGHQRFIQGSWEKFPDLLTSSVSVSAIY